jgi:catechol 2,3-dioxygenase-like lactoylglutathione lyase family enzyme
VRFVHVRLAASAEALPRLADFYARELALGGAPFRVGETTIEFVPCTREAFYHYAFLVPGDRFVAAVDWAGERVDLLPGQRGNVVFDFDFWSARACYFHDPAGNIVELIGHRGVGEAGAEGGFRPDELLGLSELGLVGDPPAMAAELERLGLGVWSGSVEEPGSLAFVGERARTLILASAGRGWLPTGRPAEPHPVEATVAAPVTGEVGLEGWLYRIRSALPG